MKVLWARPAATANEAIEALAPAADWSPKTIRTLIHRLVKKKALGVKKPEREYVYYPLVKESDCARAETRSFLRRVYGGAMRPMLAHFLEDADLSREEIEELKRLLESKEKPARR
jgi:BlaI family penicillinase repressor